MTLIFADFVVLKISEDQSNQCYPCSILNFSVTLFLKRSLFISQFLLLAFDAGVAFPDTPDLFFVGRLRVIGEQGGD